MTYHLGKYTGNEFKLILNHGKANELYVQIPLTSIATTLPEGTEYSIGNQKMHLTQSLPRHAFLALCESQLTNHQEKIRARVDATAVKIGILEHLSNLEEKQEIAA